VDNLGDIFFNGSAEPFSILSENFYMYVSIDNKKIFFLFFYKYLFVSFGTNTHMYFWLLGKNN